MVAGSLIWPELRRRGRNEALRPLLMFHSFRFVGLAFLVPGVVSPDLPAVFAEGAAYGDIVAAALALLTLALLTWQTWHRRGLGIQPVGQRRYPPC